MSRKQIEKGAVSLDSATGYVLTTPPAAAGAPPATAATTTSPGHHLINLPSPVNLTRLGWWALG